MSIANYNFSLSFLFVDSLRTEIFDSSKSAIIVDIRRFWSEVRRSFFFENSWIESFESVMFPRISSVDFWMVLGLGCWGGLESVGA